MISNMETDCDKEFMLDIYQRYYKLIRKTIYKVIKNSKDLDDLTNDTFVKLIEKILIIRNLSCHKLTTYIVYTAKTVAIDYIKHRDVINKHTFYGDKNDLAEDLPDDSIGFEEILNHQMDVELLCQAIQNLPEAKKDILYYKYFLDMKDAEIAKLYGISTNSVPQYLKRARNAAKKLIEKGADTYANSKKRSEAL